MPTLQLFFNPCASCVLINVIRTCVTIESKAPSLTFLCGWSRCNICPHTNTSTFIDTAGGRITFTSKYACLGENEVYDIKCHACHKIYIGKTGRRLGDRFREHPRSTRIPDSDLPGGRHFASPGNTTQNMLVSVIRLGFRDAADRRTFEARMIIRHHTLHPASVWPGLSFARAFFSCFQTTYMYEEGAPSKRLVHILNSRPQ